MLELVHLSWRAYPAALLIAAGLAAAVWSAQRGVARARRLRDPGRALAVMQGFRLAIVGLAVAAVGAAWWWDIGWLFGLALVIGGQELLESTVVITALKHGVSKMIAPARPRSSADGAAPSGLVSRISSLVSRLSDVSPGKSSGLARGGSSPAARWRRLR